MNYNNLTDAEFLNLLHTEGNKDPIVMRLLKIIDNSIAVEAINELIKSGMDKDTWEMDYDGLQVTPAEYIRRLEADIEYRSIEYANLEFDFDQVKKELKDMQTRSVADLIQELQQELKTADYLVRQANERTQRAKDAETNAKSKLDMWAIMNR